MKNRGRPKQTKSVIVFRTSITLYPGEDDDLIEFFIKQPQRKRSIAIKVALRDGKIEEKGYRYENENENLDQTIIGLVF